MSHKEIPLGSGFTASEMSSLDAREALNAIAYPMGMLDPQDVVFQVSNTGLLSDVAPLFVVERPNTFFVVQPNGRSYTQPRSAGDRVCYMATTVNRVGAASPMLYWGFGRRTSEFDERRAAKVMLAGYGYLC